MAGGNNGGWRGVNETHLAKKIMANNILEYFNGLNNILLWQYILFNNEMSMTK
jgi:hypothetical protein